MKIEKFSETYPSTSNIIRTFSKPIIMYRKHPSILAIKNENYRQMYFLQRHN